MSDKIDFVITWVDGSDPAWLAEKKIYIVNDESNDCRYRDWDLLRYWFRGVEKFAPWVNKIHFVTWGHVPEWLDIKHPKLNIVKHSDFIPQKYLPTFNANTVELNFHRINGLSEQFVYFNDDVFLIDYVKKQDFFDKGKPKDTCSLEILKFDSFSFSHLDKNNINILNDHYDKGDFIRRNWRNLLSPKVGKKKIIKNLLLMPFNFFTGFYNHHLASSFKKSTYIDAWGKYTSVLDASCITKNRGALDVNQYLLKDLQFINSQYEQRGIDFGKRYNLSNLNLSECCQDIQRQKYKCICINDSEILEDISLYKDKLIISFEQILQNKSNFEL